MFFYSSSIFIDSICNFFSKAIISSKTENHLYSCYYTVRRAGHTRQLCDNPRTSYFTLPLNVALNLHFSPRGKYFSYLIVSNKLSNIRFLLFEEQFSDKNHFIVISKLVIMVFFVKPIHSYHLQH